MVLSINSAVEERFDFIKAETAGDSEAKLGSQVDRNSLKEIMDDFGDVLKLFVCQAHASVKQWSTKCRNQVEGLEDPSVQCEATIMRQRSTPTTTRGRSTAGDQ